MGLIGVLYNGNAFKTGRNGLPLFDTYNDYQVKRAFICESRCVRYIYTVDAVIRLSSTATLSTLVSVIRYVHPDSLEV